jgi:transcriptional regulator with XRE-family HTH domain
MSKGYTVSIVRANADADPHLLGVQLGQYCIPRNISVAEVAAAVGVTRATIYNWFCGGTIGKATHVEAVRTYLGLEDAVD